DPHRAALSAAQRRIWVLHQLDPLSPANNLQAVYLVVGPFDVLALGQALKALIQRHESLRTVFHLADDVPFQRILCELPSAVMERDFSLDADPGQSVKTFMAAEGQEPFDLE